MTTSTLRIKRTAIIMAIVGCVFSLFLSPSLAEVLSTEVVSVDSQGGTGAMGLDPSTSADGRYVAFESYADNLVSNDTNLELDIFVRDLGSSLEGIQQLSHQYQ